MYGSPDRHKCESSSAATVLCLNLKCSACRKHVLQARQQLRPAPMLDSLRLHLATASPCSGNNPGNYPSTVLGFGSLNPNLSHGTSRCMPVPRPALQCQCQWLQVGWCLSSSMCKCPSHLQSWANNACCTTNWREVAHNSENVMQLHLQTT